MKCKICGKTLTKSCYIIYRDTISKKTGEVSQRKEGYCSQLEYLDYQQEKEKQQKIKDEIYMLFCTFLDEKDIINTVFWAEWRAWNTVATNEDILDFLKSKSPYICTIMDNKMKDASEFNKIRYISAIIKNSINDFVKENKKKKEEERREKEKYINGSFVDIDFTLFSPTSNSNTETKTKRTLAEVEELL